MVLPMKSKKDKELVIGELTDYPNDQYRKFFEKFKEIDGLDVKDWKTTHVLSYFCRKYEDQYQLKYKFKFNQRSFEEWKTPVLQTREGETSELFWRIKYRI